MGNSAEDHRSINHSIPEKPENSIIHHVSFTGIEYSGKVTKITTDHFKKKKENTFFE